MMTTVCPTIPYGIRQLVRMIVHVGRNGLVSMILAFSLGTPFLLHAEPATHTMTKEQALKLGEDFGIVVGEVEEEIQDFLGLEGGNGVVPLR